MRSLFAVTVATSFALTLAAALIFILDHWQPTVARAAGETVQFDAAAYSVNEADGTATITVTLSSDPGVDVTVDYATSDGTATAGDDYTPASGTLTFTTSGALTQTFTVAVTDDALNETSETITLTLSNETGAGLGTQNPVALTILDNDPQPSLSIADVTVTETNASLSAVFTVTLSAASGQTVTVDYATADGTATAPADYTALPTTPLSFNPGQTAKAITVTVAGDTLNEASETFFVNLTTPGNATIGDAQGQGTINNDDPLPSLSITDVTVTETNASLSAVFTVTLSAASGQTVTVDYATADGAATAPADYTALPTTPLSFNPGQTAKAITVTVAGDTLNEASETFFVNLADPTNASISDSQGQGTINNDDPQPSLSITDVTVTETNASLSAVFTVTLSAASGQTVTVDYATADGTATAPADYTALPTTPLSFNPGQTAKAITVTVAGDTLNEADETFFVNLADPTNASISDSQGLGTINNDDPLPSLSITDVTVTETNTSLSAVFTVTLSAASGQTVTVDYATADGTATAPADYAAISTTPLSFAPGQTAKAITVTVAGDLLNEASETFFVNLTTPGNATIGDAQGQGAINNDDPQPSLSITDVTVTETNASLGAVFTVTLSAASGQTVTVDYATADGTATAPADYTAISATLLSFAPGQTEKAITVTVEGDLFLEFNETFFVNLSSPGNATIGDSQGRGAINNDDAAPTISLSASTYSVNENVGTGTAAITATLTGQTEITATVNYSTTNGTAAAGSDYTGIAGTLTFTPGVTSQTINVPITNDTTFETNETFTVTLSAQVSATLTSPTTAVVTIVEDDPIPAVRYTPDPQIEFTALEGNSPAGYSVPITVTLDRASVFTVTAAYSTTDGTAIAGADYVTATGTLTFDPGITTQTFSVTVKGNTFNGPNKTVNLNLGSVVSATVGGDNPETLLIIDDDGPPQIYFSAPTYPRAENASPATIQVNLSNASNLTVTAVVTITDGTASRLTDYNAPLTRTVTITGNLFLTSASFTIPITDDTTFEGDETINLALGSPVNAEMAGFNETAVLTIQDNETQPTVRFTSGSYSVNESGGSAVITATLSNASAFTATVNVATSNGTGVGRATAGSDYTAVNGTLTFIPGTITTTFPVTITNDTAFEGNEVLTLTLGPPISNTTLGSPNPATLTIVDNESPPTIQLSAPAYTVEEYGGSATITATLAFAGGTTSSAVPVTVTVATSNITATAGSDYTAVNTALTFTPPVITNTVAVPIVNDTAFEGNETFRLTLSNPLSATLGITTTAVITIFDNDPRPGCTIFNSTNVPKPIPDDKPTGIDSVLVIPGPGVVITDTSVRINQLMHTFVGDLNITLVAPNGTTILRVVNQISGTQYDKDNFIHTILNDSYPIPIANGLAPFTGNFSPYNSLSSLDGLASGGTWTLNVSDNASGDTGTLNAWGLEICGSGTAPTYHVYLPLILR